MSIVIDDIKMLHVLKPCVYNGYI